MVSLSDLNRDLNLIHSEYLMKKKIDGTTTQIFQAGIGCRSRKLFQGTLRKAPWFLISKIQETIIHLTNG